MIELKEQKMYRQGDILIVPYTNKLPARMEPLKHKIVERGELTGHAHVVDEYATLFGLYDTPEFIVADHDTKLKHQEHDTIVIPEGQYRIIRQREFDGTEARFVAD